jgi:hypothetical protein
MESVDHHVLLAFRMSSSNAQSLIACSIVGILTACWKLNLMSPLSGGSHRPPEDTSPLLFTTRKMLCSGPFETSN